MAEGKKSFMFYCEWIDTFEELSDEEAGKLIKHILQYVNDKNPQTEDKVTKISFIPIKQQLKRDLKKWEELSEKQRLNGLKGGRPKKAKETKKSRGFSEKPKKAVEVEVEVEEEVKEISKDIIPARDEFIKYGVSKKPDVDTSALGLKYDAWVEAGWVNGNGAKIKNWKSAVNNTLPYLKTKAKLSKDWNFGVGQF